jgi:hypothetical protein
MHYILKIRKTNKTFQIIIDLLIVADLDIRQNHILLLSINHLISILST